MKYGFNSGIWGNMFGVPNIIADNFLKLATEVQLKVIIYLLRNSGNEYTESEISKNTGVSEDGVREAIIFWQQANILPEKSENTENSIFTYNKIPDAPSVLSEPTVKNIEITSSTQININPAEISQIRNSSEENNGLFSMVEGQLGVLKHPMLKSLVWMLEYLGLKPEVIAMLIAYCVSVNKTNIAYMDKIAYSWSERGINTHELAQEEVNRLRESFEFISRIKKIFEMKRNPTSNQKEYLKIWQGWNFSDELLKFAYEKTIEKTDKLSFEYMNKILLSWHNQNISTLEQAKKADEEFKNRSGYSKTKFKDEKKLKSEEIAKKYEIFTKNV